MNTFVKTVILGAGNVATHLAKTLPSCGFGITQIYSRTLNAAEELASRVGADFTNELNNIDPTADLYIYALTDTALPQVVAEMPIHTGIHVHTSGSVNIDVFKDHQYNYGVLYPLQSFSKYQKVDMKHVPLFVEGNNALSTTTITELAQRISHYVKTADSDARKTLHLAGVLTNNFTNALCCIAADILKEQEIPIAVMIPLLEETVNKLKVLHPNEAQTGPARRNDLSIINEHQTMLANNPRWQNIYRLLTEEIQSRNKEH